MAYALGKFALGLCDRCGFEYKLNDLRKEWNNLKTCPECFEPKAPQLTPTPVVTDSEALYNPRPNNDLEVGEGFVVVTYTNIAKGNSMDPNTIGSNFVSVSCTASVGNLTTTQNVPSNIAVLDGLSATSNLGSVSVVADTGTSVTLSGLAGTSALGTVTVTGASSLTTYTITVASYSGANYFYIDGSRAATLNLSEGSAYRFNQSDSSNSNHPLRISTTSDGTHGGGSAYTTGVTTNGTPGSSGAYTQIQVASGAPTLYYYCTNHSGMGGQINT